MSRYLLVSDFHDDRGANGAWAWLSSPSTYMVLGRVDGVLYGGDWIGRITKIRTTQLQVYEAQRYLAGFRTAPWIASPTGNHDWREEHSIHGSSAWLNAMSIHSHVKTHGVHALAKGWRLEICDWLEEPSGEIRGLDSILLIHNGPTGPTTTTRYGICRGDFLLTEYIKWNAPAIVAHGHEHQPRQHFHRLGRSLVLNPGVSAFPGEVNHIVIDTDANRCEFRGDGGRHEVAAIYA